MDYHGLTYLHFTHTPCNVIIICIYQSLVAHLLAVVPLARVTRRAVVCVGEERAAEPRIDCSVRRFQPLHEIPLVDLGLEPLHRFLRVRVAAFGRGEVWAVHRPI